MELDREMEKQPHERYVCVCVRHKQIEILIIEDIFYRCIICMFEIVFVSKWWK